MIPNETSLSSALLGRPFVHLIAQVGASPEGHAPAGRGGAAPGAAPSPFGSMVPLLLFGVIFYLMVFRPMSKQRKDQEEMNKSLRKGDKVVTRGGVIGTVTGIDDQEVVLEVAEKVRMKFTRASIETKYEKPAEKSAESSTSTASAEKKS
ncbi:MAG: preprotein translocase subunit YajC [Polyangiales bacterium]